MTRSRVTGFVASRAVALGVGLCVGMCGMVSAAFGQARPPAATGSASVAASVDRLRGEIARLQGELERTNSEIAALKRGARGVRDDYRLRSKMADAEALARRLTTAEAELRRLQGGSGPAAAPAVVVSAEAPGVLEAKADILEDQARRIAAQANAFARAATQARSRQTLRRRANQLERDPFAGFDGAKRSMVVQGAKSVTESTVGGSRTLGGTTNQGNFASADSSRTAAPPPTGGAAPAPGASVAPGAPGTTTAPPPPPPPQVPAGEATPTATPQDTNTTSPPSISTPITPAPATTTVAPQLRTLLDPATVAELKRLESGAAASDPAALERAAALLRARAGQLGTQAEQLRARARAR